jgi:hypothetical protein
MKQLNILILLVGLSHVARGQMTTCSNCPADKEVTIGDGIDITNIQVTGSSNYVESEFLNPDPSILFTAPTKSACFILTLDFDRDVDEVDICKVSVRTKLIDEITLDCGDLQKTTNGISMAGFQDTEFTFGGDPDCEPNADTTCKLCVNAPTIEAYLGGFNIEACDCCIDCVVGPWGPWGDCDTSPEDCGLGIQTRTRSVLVQPNDCGEPCPEDLVQTRTCEVECCPVKETIDCKHNKDLIDTLEITPGIPIDEVVYSQADLFQAIRKCDGEVLLSENNVNHNGFAMNLASSVNVYKVCISWKYCASVKVDLYNSASPVPVYDGVEYAHKDCPAPDDPSWDTRCWKPDGELGEEDVDRIEFTFPDSGPSQEWKIKDIYVKTCP